MIQVCPVAWTYIPNDLWEAESGIAIDAVELQAVLIQIMQVLGLCCLSRPIAWRILESCYKYNIWDHKVSTPTGILTAVKFDNVSGLNFMGVAA